MARVAAPTIEPRGKKTKKLYAASVGETSNSLLDKLREWRRALAAEHKVPPYVIFHDATLLAIASAKPANENELGALSGIGEKKLERFGDAILKLLRNA